MSEWVFPFLSSGSDGFLAPEPGPAKILLHTTNNGPAPGSLGELPAQLELWVPRHTATPQVWVDPYRRARFQSLSLLSAGKALENKPGGVETNRMGNVVQVEINGWAELAPLWPDEWLRWLGEQVVAPIARALREEGVAVDLGRAYGKEDGRLSFTQWATESCLCGHNNAAENEHWDPDFTREQMATIAWYAMGALGQTGQPSTEESEDVPMLVLQSDGPGKGTVWVVSDVKRPLPGVFTKWEDAQFAIQKALDAKVVSAYVQAPGAALEVIPTAVDAQPITVNPTPVTVNGPSAQAIADAVVRALGSQVSVTTAQVKQAVVEALNGTTLKAQG